MVSLTADKRVLYLFKDVELIRRQLSGELTFRMVDIDPADLLDNLNTDVITPAWVCFDYDPERIAENAYAGLLDPEGKRVFEKNALGRGNFVAIVSGRFKGTGSSRETAVQCEKWSGVELIVADSFAPIYARNAANLGQLLTSYDHLEELEAGKRLPLATLTSDLDQRDAEVIAGGGLFSLVSRHEKPASHTEEHDNPGPRSIAEKILSAHAATPRGPLTPGRRAFLCVDAGYSHEFTSAQVHHFLGEELGANYKIAVDPSHFAVFEDHLIYTDGVERMAPFAKKIETLRRRQHEFQQHTGVRSYAAKDGISPGICHQVAREEFIEPGYFVLATDSHTCMAGASNALAWGVGATEYAALLAGGTALVDIPQSVRFELLGSLRRNTAAKDVMLHLLATPNLREASVNRVMEFGGPGIANLSMDERAVLCNMATECHARTAVCEGDERTIAWLADRLSDIDIDSISDQIVAPDPDTHYDGGSFDLDLASISPMVALPGDPTHGKKVDECSDVHIDIAYAGSCTAGKERDLDMYATVLREALEAEQKIAPDVRMFVQFASRRVEQYAKKRGYVDLFKAAGVTLVAPGCGACIGCGPGVSENAEQITISSINRNFDGRSGPGALYLASPLTVAASAVAGHITAYSPKQNSM